MPKISEQDTLVVQNIDLNCSFIDPENGVSHSKYFEVKYDGIPHRIEPGKIRPFPRYLAEHYAKHLADHILMKKETDEGRVGLMRNKVERKKVLEQIILGVDNYFYSDVEEKKEEKEDKSLVEERMYDPNKPKEVKLDDLEEVDDEPEMTPEETEVIRPLKTKKELFAECEELEIVTTGKETVDDLYKLIEKF